MAAAAAVILAAGEGTRMRSARAKVLHELCGRPMLAYVLDTARAAGADPVVVVAGAGEDQVRAAFSAADLRWVSQPERKGTGDAVRRAQPALAGFHGTALVLYGDVPLLRPEAVQGLLAAHRQAAAVVSILTCELADPAAYGRVVRGAHGEVRGIVEFADASEDVRRIREINSGTMALELPRAWELLERLRPDNRKGEFYLTDLVALALVDGLAVAAVRAAEPTECLGINTQEELSRAAAVVNRRNLSQAMSAGVRVVAPDLTWLESGVEIGPETAILPFSVIHAGVKIGAHCEVGPFAHLRAGTVLEDHAEIGNFVEVKKSRVGAHSKAKHLSYLGDATLGAHVNIGAGTITANYDGKHKHATVIEDRASTGSGTVLVAPVRMGKGSSTGAGAIVTRGRDVPEDTTVAGVPARPLRREAGKHAASGSPALSKGKPKR